VVNLVDTDILVRRLERLEDRIEAIERILEMRRIPRTSMNPEGGYGLVQDDFVSY